MRYYIIAGEASGDLHGSNLIKELKRLDAHASFRAWGGDLMEAQGATLVKHYRELAFMGFTEVLMNIRTIFKNLDACKADILSHKPDALILIDYPGFNMRIAEFAKKHGMRVFYYISPQVWAWKQSRVHKIKRIVDTMLVILPFEEDFYKRFHFPVTYVGHPLLDAIEHIQFPTYEDFCAEHALNPSLPLIALLPGSRKQEIQTMLPLMLEGTKQIKNYQLVVAAAPAQPLSMYQSLVNSNIPVIQDNTYNILRYATAALVTSGTATLETALFGVPEIVCYKGGNISYLIARSLIKVPYISLVNLIMNKEVVPELIQHNCTPARIEKHLQEILPDGKMRESMLHQLAHLKDKLGGSGASARAAAVIHHKLIC